MASVATNKTVITMGSLTVVLRRLWWETNNTTCILWLSKTVLYIKSSRYRNNFNLDKQIDHAFQTFQSLVLSFVHMLIVLYSSYNVEPHTAHSILGEAKPTLSVVGQSFLLTG